MEYGGVKTMLYWWYSYAVLRRMRAVSTIWSPRLTWA